MPSIKNIEKIPSLVVSGSTATLTPVGHIQVNIGAQSYRTTSTLSATLSGLTAGSLYMVYLVPSNGSIALVISANVNSVGPAGYSNWKLVGGILATSATTGAAIANIWGVITTDFVNFTLTPQGSTTNPTVASNPIVNTARWRCNSDTMEIEYNYYHEVGWNTGVATGSGTYTFPIPTGFTIDTNKIYASTDPSAMGVCGACHTFNASGNIAGRNSGVVGVYNTTRLAVTSGSSGTNNVYQLNSTDFPFGNATVIVNYRAFIPISGWSSTPLALR